VQVKIGGEIRTGVFGKNEQRQLADMRRSGAVEVDAGGATNTDLSENPKMANTINASAQLRKTYVDEARKRGRKAIKDPGR